MRRLCYALLLAAVTLTGCWDFDFFAIAPDAGLDPGLGPGIDAPSGGAETRCADIDCPQATISNTRIIDVVPDQAGGAFALLITTGVAEITDASGQAPLLSGRVLVHQNADGVVDQQVVVAANASALAFGEGHLYVAGIRDSAAPIFDGGVGLPLGRAFVVQLDETLTVSWVLSWNSFVLPRVAASAAGVFIAAGHGQPSLFRDNDAQAIAGAQGEADVGGFVAALQHDGRVQWLRTIESADLVVQRIVADDAGVVGLVAGSMQATLWNGAAIDGTPETGILFFVTRIDATGALQWIARFAGGLVHDVALAGAATWFSALMPREAGGPLIAIVARVNQAGDVELGFSPTVTAPNRAEVLSIAADGDTAYLLGLTGGSAELPGGGTLRHGFVAAIDQRGHLQWSEAIGLSLPGSRLRLSESSLRVGASQVSGTTLLMDVPL